MNYKTEYSEQQHLQGEKVGKLGLLQIMLQLSDRLQGK